MPHTLHSLLLFAVSVFLPLAMLPGCSNRDGRQPISGTVTLDGRPLAGGVINFQPATANMGNTTGGTLGGDGSFLIPAAKGLVSGKYWVTVQVWKKTNRTYPDPKTGQPVKITAPMQFKETGKIEATVVAGGVNHFDIHLTSAP